MKAIILAAGYATRLYPLTKTIPKPLLQIGDKTIIDYLIEQIETIESVDEIIVVTNDKFYANFEKWNGSVKSTKKVSILNDLTTSVDDRKGAIGDIIYTIDQYNIDDELLIIAGDNLFNYSLKDVFNFYKEKNADVVCGKEIDDINILKAFAVATLDETNKIKNLVEKPEVPPSNIGVYATYFYTKSTTRLFKDYIDAGNNPDAPGHFVEWLYKHRDVYTYIFDKECYDIGTHEALDYVRKLYSK